jgi:hypothetical protein
MVRLQPRLWVGHACCFAAPFALGILSILLGQDANWDLRNYHWYNPYALLTGRFTFDLAPGSFYNSVLDVPLFLLAQHVPAWVCGFLLGVIQGLNFIPLYMLALAMLPQWARWKHGSGAAIITALGVLGGGGLRLIGATSYDNVVSILVLSGLAIAVRSMRNNQQATNKATAAAGLLIGAAIGLKLPHAIYGVGWIAANSNSVGRLGQRLKRVWVAGFAALLGMLAFGGYWAWWLWSTFGNPIFPYFNSIFGSPMVMAGDYRDLRFVPETLTEAILFPIVFVMNPYEVGESDFTDVRIIVLYGVSLLTAAWVILGARGSAVGRPEPMSPQLRFVMTACVFAYVAWLALFGVYRYIIALEMLAPLLIVALIATWPIRQREKIVLIAVCALALVISTRTGPGERIEWGTRFVQVDVPKFSDPLRTMILMVGYEPSSWIIPSFPPEVSFVRLQGHSHDPEEGNIGFIREARMRIAKHQGEFYVLYSQSEETLTRKVLPAFELMADFDSCERVRGNLDASLRLCPVHRLNDDQVDE